MIISSQSGKILHEIQGSFEPADKFELIKDGAENTPILMFQESTGGNSSVSDSIYAYDKISPSNIVNLFDIGDRDLENVKFISLGHNVMPDILLNDYNVLGVVEFGDHFADGALGPLLRIYSWTGTKYIDSTLNYPDVTKPLIEKLRRLFLASLPKEEEFLVSPNVNSQADCEAFSYEDVMAPALNYYANSIESGREAEAEQTFQQKASPILQDWLDKQYPLLKQAIGKPGSPISTNDEKMVGFN